VLPEDSGGPEGAARGDISQEHQVAGDKRTSMGLDAAIIQRRIQGSRLCIGYIWWEMADGSVKCRLVAGKTWIVPKCKFSIPRVKTG
jgi:hypothetical protein